jgi:hypothetical protein
MTMAGSRSFKLGWVEGFNLALPLAPELSPPCAFLTEEPDAGDLTRFIEMTSTTPPWLLASGQYEVPALTPR